eukprot:PhM_4_TR17375/c0_g2_i1/m.73150
MAGTHRALALAHRPRQGGPAPLRRRHAPVRAVAHVRRAVPPVCRHAGREQAAGVQRLQPRHVPLRLPRRRRAPHPPCRRDQRHAARANPQHDAGLPHRRHAHALRTAVLLAAERPPDDRVHRSDGIAAARCLHQVCACGDIVPPRHHARRPGQRIRPHHRKRRQSRVVRHRPHVPCVCHEPGSQRRTCTLLRLRVRHWLQGQVRGPARRRRGLPERDRADPHRSRPHLRQRHRPGPGHVVDLAAARRQQQPRHVRQRLQRLHARVGRQPSDARTPSVAAARLRAALERHRRTRQHIQRDLRRVCRHARQPRHEPARNRVHMGVPRHTHADSVVQPRARHGDGPVRCRQHGLRHLRHLPPHHGHHARACRRQQPALGTQLCVAAAVLEHMQRPGVH